MRQTSGSASSRQNKSATDVNNELKLNGDKVVLEDRRLFKENYTASSKTVHLSQGPARPSSAIPMLRLYKKNDDFEPSFCSTRRPYSAENFRPNKLDKNDLSDLKPNFGQFSTSLQSIDELEQDLPLPSSDLLKTIISDQSDSWGILKKSSLTQRKSKDTSRLDSTSLSLTPGLAKKPPIPKKAAQHFENKDQNLSKAPETIRSDYTEYSNRSNLELLENFTKKYEAIEEKMEESRCYNNNREKDVKGFENYDFDKYVSPVTFSNQNSENAIREIPEIKCEDWDLKGSGVIEMKSFGTDVLFPNLELNKNDSMNSTINTTKTVQKGASGLKPKGPTLKTEQRKTIKFTPKMITSPKETIQEQPVEIETWLSKEAHGKTSNLPSSSPNNDVDTWILENSLDDEREKYSNRILREFLDTPEESSNVARVNQNENQEVLSNDGSSTYDEIASILELLEGETKKSQNQMTAMKDIINTELSHPEVIQNPPDNSYPEEPTIIPQEDKLLLLRVPPVDGGSNNVSSNYNELLSYLDEVDKNCSRSLNMAKERVYEAQKLLEHTINLDTVPKVRDLLSFSKTDLSQQIIDQTLRLKEKSSSVNLLQSELTSLRNQIVRMSKEGDELIRQKIRSEKEACELVVKRHQKFIDQLIADKKKLSERYESLLKEMKSMEDRFENNVKALDHKHKVELQKVKDMHVAAEKMRRDKWIDNKTKKIKEMTVKSIEPELESMNQRQQRELADLRSLHKQEIEDLELKAARRSQEQCEKLREQLTGERERALAHERDIIRIRYDSLVESEEKAYQEQRRRLLQEHANRLSECEEREANALLERDRAIKMHQQEFDDKLQAALRRQSAEIEMVKERTEVEMESWRNDYRRRQAKQLLEKETGIRAACKTERDREIETVIERLEAEAADTKQQIEESTENRIKRMKEKFETELKDLEQTERDAQGKCNQLKIKLADGDDQIRSLNAEMKQLHTQLNEHKELYGKLLRERNEVQDIVRAEMKGDMDSLRMEVQKLHHGKDNEMQQICARVKVALARKEEFISDLSRDNGALQEKCKYLQSMLDQQRKDYLIK